MNTYNPLERPSRFKFNDGSLLALLLAVCLIQIVACYLSATGTIKPEVAAVLASPNGTAVAHSSSNATNNAGPVTAPVRDTRG